MVVSAETNYAPRTPTGTIAYVVGDDAGDQIWLMDSTGSNKRQIYTTGVADKSGFITSLAWRPDGGALIFTSNYERYCSWYEYDVYAIQSNGSSYRRVTNGPACAGLAALPQGGVAVDNSGSGYGYAVYVQGAPGPKFDKLGTASFDQVADFGNVEQPIVLFNGGNRAMGGKVDVKAGQAVNPSAGVYTNFSTEISAFRPVWKRDGSKIGYAFGCAELRGIADQPAPGNYGQTLFQATGVAPCMMAWAPTADKANQFVYFSRTGEAGIYGTTENGSSRTPLVTMQELSKVFQIQYLPDASGFIYTFLDHSTSSQVYRYDFQSDSITQLTNLSNEFARDFAISPDGQFIVFERAPDELMAAFGGASDLWIMGIDGSNPHLLVAGAAHPTWIQNVIQVPGPVPPGGSTGTANAFKMYLPLVVKK